MGFLRNRLKNKIFSIKFYYLLRKISYDFFHLEKYIIKRNYKKVFRNFPNLDNPKTLNEKIQWLKLYDKNSFYTLCADKYSVRKYFAKNFGPEGLIPLEYQTYNWKDIKPENIPNHPCIIKANHGSGMHVIIRDKNKVDWKKLQHKCREWLNKNYYYRSLEWQYKNIRPCIIVEKLLVNKKGKIPNDYKLNYFNGKLEFIYCSIGREEKNYRNIYSPNWKPLHFSWVGKGDHRSDLIGPKIKKPRSFNKMVKIGNEIAKRFKLVRVDFYDLNGKLYYGEITLHHGGGFYPFEPKKYDLIYGNKLNLKKTR